MSFAVLGSTRCVRNTNTTFIKLVRCIFFNSEPCLSLQLLLLSDVTIQLIPKCIFFPIPCSFSISCTLVDSVWKQNVKKTGTLYPLIIFHRTQFKSSSLAPIQRQDSHYKAITCMDLNLNSGLIVRVEGKGSNLLLDFGRDRRKQDGRVILRRGSPGALIIQIKFE